MECIGNLRLLDWYRIGYFAGKTGADWDSAPEQTGTLLMLQS